MTVDNSNNNNNNEKENEKENAKPLVVYDKPRFNLAVNKEFIVLVVLIGVMFFALVNNQDAKILQEAKDNTDKIIHESIERFNILENNTAQRNNEDKQMGVDVINLLFLYLKDIDLNQEKLMKHHNITNKNTILYNQTHIWTELNNGTHIAHFEMPYPLNLTNIGTLANKTDHIKEINMT